MKVVSLIKKNMTVFFVLVAYMMLFVFKTDYGVQAVKNSTYYIIEMFQIMPVVFLLTALLDAWVPTETITKYLGKESKSKGTFFAFILGSISAGPIYAAFPICGLLIKKGATIKNIVIILSSWAVIKIPMLINEVAFLGMKFMAIRWILTIIAIIIFSNLAGIFVKSEDIPKKDEENEATASIDKNACVGCGVCKRMCQEVFDINDKKAIINYDNLESVDLNKLKEVAKSCPMKAIRLNK